MRAIQARSEGDIVLCQDIGQLPSELPEVGLQGEVWLDMFELFGEKGQCLSIEISPGQERLSAVEGECHGILAKIIEPCHHIPNGINAHHRRSNLGTPAITAFGGTPERRDDHDMKRPLLSPLPGPGHVSPNYSFCRASSPSMPITMAKIHSLSLAQCSGAHSSMHPAQGSKLSKASSDPKRLLWDFST